MILPALLLATVHIIDGDTIDLDGERIRIAAVDAPELHRCPRTRICTPGDGKAARAWLERFVARGRVQVTRRLGFDRYGRTVACVSVNGWDVSHALVAAGHAVERYRKLEDCR